jgi:hypothetical protein
VKRSLDALRGFAGAIQTIGGALAPMVKQAIELDDKMNQIKNTLAGTGCKACRQLKRNVVQGVCSDCSAWIVEMTRTSALSASEVVDMIQALQTLEGRTLAGFVANLPGSAERGWRRQPGEDDDEFRARILTGRSPQAPRIADGSRVFQSQPPIEPLAPLELARVWGPGVTQHQFGQLPDWDRVVLETGKNDGKLELELADFQVAPVGQINSTEEGAELSVTWAQPKDDGGSSDPPCLFLPQKLLQARVLRDVDGDNILFLTVGRGVLEEPQIKPAVKARNRVLIVVEFAVSLEQEGWTELGEVIGDIIHEGKLYSWRYKLGGDGLPILVIAADRDQFADRRVRDALYELGIEQFAACMLGEVPAHPRPDLATGAF